MTYTHGHAGPVLTAHRRRTAENSAAYLLPHLTPTDRLLDVGAGPGTITAGLAERVGAVTATEIGPDELDLTRRLAAERGLDIALSVEDVHALSFADDAFDVAHAHQVLQHVEDPVQALREMARVTRPGGLVAVRDADYAGMFWYPLVPELDEWRRLYSAAARANRGEPDAGRRLLAWARGAGLRDVTASTSSWLYATPDDRAWWAGTWAERVTASALAEQLVREGRATRADLDRVADGWRRWAADDDAWFVVPHGELLVRVR